MSLINNKVPYPVLLPKWVFEAQDKDHFKKNLASYIKHYPHYIVTGIKDGFAICERRE